MLSFLEMKKVAQYLVFSLFATYCLIYAFHSPVLEKEKPLAAQITVVMKSDYADYQNAKTDAEKLAKADALLKKIAGLIELKSP
jgi:hypothetical protein